MSPFRLALSILLFLGLTGGGLYWAFSSSEARPADLARIWALPPGTLAGLAALSVLVYVTDSYRYRTVARALGVRLSVGACVEAVIANFFFAWITPAGALGTPAVMVLLHRRGVPWSVGFLISMAKSLTGVALLLTVSFCLLCVGLGPASLSLTVRSVLLTAMGFFALTFAFPLVGAIFPEGARRTLDRVDRLNRERLGALRVATATTTALRETIDRLSRLLSHGKVQLIPITLAHLLYFASFLGVLVLLLHAIGGADPLRAWVLSLAYGAFTFVAPTPGGSGFAEAAATGFFGKLVDPRDAVVSVLLFRVVTFYLQILVGLLYLPFMGGIREVLRGAKRP